MLLLTLSTFLALDAEAVLNRVELYTVRGDGGSCGLLPEADRPIFRRWRLDPERTAEERGIFGLFNPERPNELVLFFANQESCERALGLFEDKEWIERAPGASPRDAPPPPPPPPPPPRPGNPRDISLADALEDALALPLFPTGSLWCACEIDVKTRRCTHDGEEREIRHAPVVPIREFGPTFSAWTDGDTRCERRGRRFSGRRCAAQVDETFRRMAADLYNLAPQLARASYLDRELRDPLGKNCEFNLREGRMRPSERHRGVFARVYLYMNRTYPEHVRLEPALRNVLVRWSQEMPPRPDECAWARAVADVQGGNNPVLETACPPTAP